MKTLVNLNIALAGDHALNLHALASLLGQHSSFRVTSISKDVNQLSNNIASGGQEQYPHIVLLDINFDLHRAAGIISFLKTAHPDIRIAALGLTKDRAAILRLHQMGVDSYIPKNSDPDHLENVLRRLAKTGENATPSTHQAQSATANDGEPDATAPDIATVKAWPPITPTERRYFRLAMSEASHQDIRRTLKLPESTFARLVTALYHRFGVTSRDGLVLALYRNRFMIMDDL
jgi:DNA-binding NarL/FixJ family response regulator